MNELAYGVAPSLEGQMQLVRVLTGKGSVANAREAFYKIRLACATSGNRMGVASVPILFRQRHPPATTCLFSRLRADQLGGAIYKPLASYLQQPSEIWWLGLRRVG